MGSYSVQQLDPGYISKVNPQQVQKWVEDGIVKQQGDSYYVVSGTGVSFPESCFVRGADGKPQTYRLDAKGLIVERNSVQQEPKGEVVSTSTEISIPTNMLVERMGLAQDETLKAEFLTYMVEQQKLNVDQDGNINFQNMSQEEISKTLGTMMKGFAASHPEKFVDPNAEKYVEFTADSDAGAIQQLSQGENPAIAEQPEVAVDGSKRYAVRNEGVLKEELSTPVGEIKYEEAAQGRSASIEATSVTTTTTKEGVIDVPEGLRDSKKARKQVEADAREGYAKLLDQANSDPDLRNAIDLYIAERKYNGKIEKRMAELSEYSTTMGGTKEKTTKRDDADIVQLYINKYANEEDRDALNGLVERIQNSSDPEDQKLIMDALKKSTILGLPDNFEQLTPELRKKGALLAMSEACGLDSKSLLKLMATYDVMNERSPEQVLKDDEYFIKEQAEDFTRNKQVQQDVPNTTVHFSKSGRKDAPEDGKIHNDIGKKGRALVQACPEMLCDEITDPSKFKDGEDGYFKTEINGQTRYFKFNQDKWKTFMGICCDPSTATDDAMKILFGDNATAKENFIKDLNMTLQEGRSVLDMNLPSPYGETGTLNFKQIIGNSNDTVDNRELNALRDMVESAGYSVDRNTTAGKRLLHVLKNAGIGTGIGLLTGGLGSLFGGALQFAGQTAAQNITLKGPVSLTGDVSLDYHDNVITTDYYTDQYGTTAITHDTPVSGTAHGQATLTGDASLSGQADGQHYGGSMQNHWETAKNSGILGGIGGTVHGLATMRGVNAQGRNTDDVFDLTRLVSTEGEPDTKNLSIEIPQFTTVETRRGEKEVGFDIAKLPAVRWQGPAAYHKMYKYEDGTPVSASDFAKAYKKQINGEMTNRYFYVFTELEVNGKKLVPVDNYEEEYKKIREGVKGNVAGVTINPQGKRKVTIEGTIRS